MLMKFTLPMCPPLNSLYRYGRRGMYKIAKARAWETDAIYKIKRVRWDRKPITGTIEMWVHLYLKRDRDIDGSLKLILDVFEKAGVYENDSQVTVLQVRKQMDKKNPRIEIIINLLGGL